MAPETALHDFRRSLGADAEDSAERRRPLRERYLVERDALPGWARSAGCILAGADYLNRVTGGGAEHAVFFDPELQAYVKITRGFGLTAGTDFRIGKRTQKYLAVPFVRQATPLEYLERLALFNELFGDDIRVAGVIAGPESAIVTTQPVIRGRDASSAEIVSFMAGFGFAPLVCDNLSSHKVSGVREAIAHCGAELLHLPAYSPDLNPIELAFAKLKAFLRQRAQR